ncbi:hypothetical protein [Kushneria aurantia]|uniref:DUF2798 domain-containing protein n=1 Tax=Kushneria aurantia TaxID=504092 RepID=A0ABV6G4L6_9GAMM|nr:hypothetical protein [Kushneria aurantia]
MKTSFLLPLSVRNRVLLALFVVVILAGIWPAIGLVNSAALVLGVPLLAAWSCLIPLACTALMLLANRLNPLSERMTERAERAGEPRP